MDVLISPICHQNFANGPVGEGLVLVLATENITHKHLCVLSVVCFLSVVSINTCVTSYLPLFPPSIFVFLFLGHLCSSR